MKNINAIKINEALSLKIYDENNTKKLELCSYSKKQIKQMFIDDLINVDTKRPTKRLIDLTNEILNKNQ